MTKRSESESSGSIAFEMEDAEEEENELDDGIFDSYDTTLYVFSKVSRQKAEKQLRVAEVGTFMIRPSNTKIGSFSLSVKVPMIDENPIRHFLIDQTDGPNQKYKINGQVFRSIPALVNHFRTWKLGSGDRATVLLRPAPRKAIAQIVGRVQFKGERTTDLPFNSGEVLDVLEKPEKMWWVARNALGDVGLVPRTHVRKVTNENIHDVYFEHREITAEWLQKFPVHRLRKAKEGVAAEKFQHLKIEKSEDRRSDESAKSNLTDYSLETSTSGQAEMRRQNEVALNSNRLIYDTSDDDENQRAEFLKCKT
ncbi:SH2 domain protein [Aphelenchoides besseyi]|nr:SH2 domain protein [Aphelenchoides besseyi]KAI6195455.1 SH2 domain protein [Aphelenchoides besseyi]